MQTRTAARAFGAAITMSFVPAAFGQVVINEIYENPPGSGAVADAPTEYIELYGKPGMDLTGYAIGLLKGGADADGDDVPDPGGDPPTPEIDECFALDGWEIGPNGFFVIYNTAGDGSDPDDFTFLDTFLTPNPGYDDGQPESPTNKRFLDGAGFTTLHIPSSDVDGNLSNDNSSTYVLVRKRPNHMVSNGVSVYLPGYAFRKEINQDVNFDSAVDFGTETPIAGSPPPSEVEHYQMVDDFAWSNNGGKEYTRSGQQELSETPGFNPDAASRLRYYLDNPLIGVFSRGDADGPFEIIQTRTADESWIYGDIIASPATPDLEYDTTADVLGFVQTKAPTDPDAPGFDGTCDPEPDDDRTSVSCAPTGGVFLFTDIDVTGFLLTPAALNDHPSDPDIRQFRFGFTSTPTAGPFDGAVIERPDFDFDLDVDADDLALIQAKLGASLDDTQPAIYDNGTPDDTGDDISYDEFVHQGRTFQQLLKMLDMDMTDGDGGMNADFVTQADVDAVAALLDTPCPGDADGDDMVNLADLNLVLASFNTAQTPGTNGDVTGDGLVDLADLNLVLGQFNTVCD